MKRRWSAIALALGLGCTSGCAGLDVQGTLVDGSLDGALLATADAADGPFADGQSASCAPGHSGPTCACATGTHACGTDCSAPYPNDPDAGCALGCGAPCPVPDHGMAQCTSLGTCDFTCDQGFYAVDAGTDAGSQACACPANQKACGTTCAACCTYTDCPPHVLCTSAGACTGCEPSWADCNNDPADGCEADLTQGGNCGSCGNSCCSWPCCGGLVFHGQSCQPNASTFTCQC